MPSRAIARSLTAALALLCLSACSASMEMTISPQGTYSAVVELRDTTGTSFTEESECTALGDPQSLGVPDGTTVTTEYLTGDKDKGCLVTVSGVRIPSADEADNALVVRDGDQFSVTLPRFGDAAGATPGSADDSLNSVVEARVAITFPGAVTRAPGGTVTGSTVVWDDADVLAEGVSASGYAQQGRGVSWWERIGAAYWGLAALTVAGLVLGAATVRRRRRRRRRDGEQAPTTRSAKGSAARVRRRPR